MAINSIEALRLRALALRSSIHNENQLSAIELTAMCAKKTNELIAVINELCEIINALDGSGGGSSAKLQYNESTEELNIV